MTAVLGVIQFTIFFIILIFTKMIFFACEFVVFLLFFWTHQNDCFRLSSNLSIILDIFQKKTTLQENGYKAQVNLREFVIIYNIATLDEMWVITCWVKGEKRTKKLINTNVIARHNAFEMCRDLQSWRSSFIPFKHICYFQFLIFEIIRFVVWFYVLSVIFPRLLISLNFVSLICF